MNMYRARIGLFSGISGRHQQNLFFLDKTTTIPFLCLAFAKEKEQVALSVLLYISAVYSIADVVSLLQKCRSQRNSKYSSPTNASSSYDTSTINNTLLLQSGDIHPNPGPTGQRELSVVHVNARSLKNKIDLFEAESHQFDIITVSETWLSPSVPDKLICLKNFHPPIRLDQQYNNNGGVAIYVREDLYCKPRPDLQVKNLEAVWVETKINQESILVGSFYRNPHAQVNYWNLIEEGIGKVDRTQTKFIILGDFNDNALPHPSQHMKDILNAYHLKQLITSPTRITNNTATCLDLVITQSPDMIKTTEVLPPFCSDHSVPCAVLKQSVHRQSSFQRMIFNYDQLDQEKFCELLGNVDWNDIFMNNSIDDASNIFTDKFMSLAKQCMPSKLVTIRSRDAAWFNNEIRQLIKKRNKLHKRAKSSNLQTDWQTFRAIRNEVIDKVRKRKLEYQNELNETVIDPAKFGQKEWWKIVRQFMSKKGIVTDNIPPLTVNGTTHYSNIDKANLFNDFFVSQCVVEDDGSPLPDTIQNVTSQLTEIVLTVPEVKKIIKELNSSKATGPDSIHNKLLIAAADIISSPLTSFFNRCLTEERFPKPWKFAHVTPVHKKGNTDECTNYRPISLLSCVGKLFERCVHGRVYNFLISNNLITSAQSGFIQGDSTIYQMLSIYDTLVTNYDKSIPVQSIFFDISKAFDRVWHRGLLCKLKAIGIKGNLLNWFSDYLSGRYQSVVIRGETSTQQCVPQGVPQGSVLGPLLFLVFINDIIENIDSDIKLFADDTSMSLGMENTATRTFVLQADLDKIDTWAKAWKVKFNESKTELLNVFRGNAASHILTFSGSILHQFRQHKHLGVILQDNCKWGDHINSIATKARLLINCLRSFKYSLTRKALETMYKSFILPIFDYADVVWDGCAEYQSKILEDLHMDALRIITGTVRGTSHEKLLKESGFCTLKERRRRHKLVTYFKILQDQCPSYISNLLPNLVSSINPYHRRRPLERIVPRHTTDVYKNSFFPSTTVMWNNLPLHIQQSQSISQLKHYLSSSDTPVPPYYYHGNRVAQINHCRMRLGMSNLNSDLFNRHLLNNPSCACQYPQETPEHFLLHCPLHDQHRTTTILNLPPNQISIQNLLYGNNSYNVQTNAYIFKTVQRFILLTKRFDT